MCKRFEILFSLPHESLLLFSVSPYLKSLSMVAANKLLHLLEVFSSPWFLFCSPVNHHLVFFLLEVFNNIIQYQFDGKLLLKLHHCCKYSCAGSSSFKWLIKYEAAKVCLFECKSFYPKTWFLWRTLVYNLTTLVFETQLFIVIFISICIHLSLKIR